MVLKNHYMESLNMIIHLSISSLDRVSVEGSDLISWVYTLILDLESL